MAGQKKKKLVIVASHPVQYYAPLFRYLAGHVDLEVLYCHNPTPEQIGKQGFGTAFTWDVDLLSGYSHRFLENKSASPSVETFNGCNTPGIGKAIRAAGATHVLIMGWFLRSFWQAYFYCLLHNIPMAVRGDSQLTPDLQQSGFKFRLRKLFYSLFLSGYSSILSVGSRNREYLRAHGAKPHKILFSPHAVDAQFWISEPAAAQHDEVIRFIWVAKFIDKKRPQDAIKAFLKLKQSHRAELVMAGTGPLLQECIALAGDDYRISFPGFKNQNALKDLYRAGDCLLLTSDHGETWGLVVNEAFCMNTPAVVSDACGCSPDMIDDTTGITYKIGDIDALVEAMNSMMEKLTEDKNYFLPGIAQKNAIYSYKNNLPAIKEFMKTR